MVPWFGRAVWSGLLALLLVATGSPPLDAEAQPAPPLARVRTQVATAKAHAGFAQAATTLPDFQQHMGHVLNCIEGKSGRNFTARWGHVCEGQGNGIIPDLREIPGRGDLVSFVQLIGSTALGASMSSRLTDAAREVAEGVEAQLEIVEDGLR